MDIAEALQLIFCTLSKFRTTRPEHQRLYEAQNVVLHYIENLSPPNTDGGKPDGEDPVTGTTQ